MKENILNGIKWDGKGYYKDNHIGFEIKDGKGNIKEYYKYGNLKFEGEVSNGEKNWKGKEDYENGKLYFEGEYLNGKIGMEKDIILMVIWNLK